MNSRGISSVMDIAMYSMIVVIAMAFLQTYSMTHQSTDVKDLKMRAEEEYAANALLAMSYLTCSGAGYRTVQQNAVESVTDPDMQPVIEAGESIRDYSRTLDEKLANWSEGIAETRSDINAEIDDAINSTAYIKDTLDAQTGSLDSGLENAAENCKNYTDGINTFLKIFSGEQITGDPCKELSEYGADISRTAGEIDKSLTEIKDTLYKIKGLRRHKHGKTEELIQQARCILKEADIKTDRFITYAQLGTKENTTLTDLWPAKANLGTKTITETIGEALYTEDRLAGSGELQAAAAFGTRIAFQKAGTGPADPKNRITQGIVLSIDRIDYRSLAEKAANSALTKQLTEQGYDYCFTAKTCCSTIQDGNCSIPPNAAKAKTNIKTPENKTAEMTLFIWKK